MPLLSAAEVRDEVIGILAEELGGEVRDIRAAAKGNTPLSELGLESFLAMEIRSQLQARFGVTLSATVCYDYPTIDRLAEHVHKLARVEENTVQDSMRFGLEPCLAPDQVS